MLFNPFIFRDLWPLHPPVGVWIGVLGLLGVLVTLLRDVTKIDKVEKAVWTSVMFSLLLLEMKSVYQDRSEHDIEQAEARAEQLRQFGNIANGISTTIAQNQEHFDATMKRSEEISQGVRAEMSSTKRVIGLSNKTLNTVTGGDSFCFVHMGWNADGFDGVIFQRGAHNVFDVNVRLIDGTALRAAEVNWVNSPAARHWRPGDKDPVNPEDYEFEASFPVVQTARSGKDDSSIHLIRLGHFKVPPSVKDQQYNIFFMTRNGGFTELDRLHRLDDGHWSEAVVVSATYYYDDKIVRVMDEADAFFPPAILASDPDVTRFRKWPLIKVELSPLLKGPS